MMYVFTITGLTFSVIGSVILVKHLFISDEEIDELSEIPVEESTTNMTSRTSSKNMPVAVTDVELINTYRNHFIQNRKNERSNGKRGLMFIIIGFALQAIDPISDLIAQIYVLISSTGNS